MLRFIIAAGDNLRNVYLANILNWLKSFTVHWSDTSIDVSIDGPWQIQTLFLSRDECEAAPQQWCSRLGSWSNLQDNFFDNLTVSLEMAAACQQNSLYFLPNDYTCCHNKIEIKISKLESNKNIQSIQFFLCYILKM